MKKILLTCAALAAISAASGQTLQVNISKGAPNALPGGEFEIKALGATSAWSAIGVNRTTWDSFCLEFDETISYTPGNYFVELDTGAKLGGQGGATAGVDPLSKGTAWLFRQHWNLNGATGNIGSAEYDVNDNSDAKELQYAIWWLEDESGESPYLIGNQSTGNKFIDAAVASPHFADAASMKADASDYEFGVGVLNLWTQDPAGQNFNASQHLAQSQLVVVPEPAAVLGSLLGLGMVGYVGFRRRKAAATQES